MSVPRTDNLTPPDLVDSPILTSLTVNCQSLLAKKESFLNLIDTYKPDIVFGTESWLKSDVLSSEVFPECYSVFRKDRSDGYGGVFIACQESLIACNLEIENNCCELVACEVKLRNGNNLIVCSAYRPPSSNVDYLSQLCNHLESIKYNHPNSAIWLSGDINLPDINWGDNYVDGHQYSLDLNNTFLEFLHNNGLDQIVDFPTRRFNTLDIFVTNRPSLIESCESVGGISDHEVIITKSSILAQLCPSVGRRIYLWSKADFIHIRQFIESLCEDFVATYPSTTPVNILWNKFFDICIQCLNLIPTKWSTTKQKQPWITRKIKQLTRKKQRAYKRARLTNNLNDWSSYQELKRLSQRECRTAFNRYVNSFIDDNGNVTKKLWSFIKNKKQDRTGISTLDHQGVTYTDPASKANVLGEYFSSVFTQEDTTDIPVLEGNPLPDIPPIEIHSDGVTQLLHNLKPHKAAGPDNLPSYFLKEVAKEISPALSMIFQASLNQGALPDIWKSALVVPVYKKGSKRDPANYRPVSLTCICSKIMEHIIYSSMFEHLNSHQALREEQHGFRQHRSCETQLITTIHDFAQCLNQQGQCDVLLLDFCKAFDKVPHSRLFYKLQFYGINGSLLTWIINFLSDRSQQVVLDNNHSNSNNVISGVPQGTVLAPLLFLVYINDLPTNILNNVRLYADDVILYSNISTEEDCYLLQNDLDLLTEWSHRWLMAFNPKKCEFLRITNKKNFTPFTYRIDNSTIQEVTHAKYLGVVIDQHLNWNEHVKQTVSKATRIKSFLHRNLYQCPPTVKCNIYKAMVRPIMEYSSTVWDPHTSTNINNLESVQRSAARMCFRDFSRFSSVTSMLNDLELPTLQSRRMKSKIQMLYKIIHNLVDVPNDCLTPVPPYLRRGYYNQLITRVDSYKFSFYPSAIKLWNNLPHSIVNTPTYTDFCNALDRFTHNHTCAL